MTFWVLLKNFIVTHFVTWNTNHTPSPSLQAFQNSQNYKRVVIFSSIFSTGYSSDFETPDLTKIIAVDATEQCQCDQEDAFSLSITHSRTQARFFRRKEFERRGKKWETVIPETVKDTAVTILSRVWETLDGVLDSILDLLTTLEYNS
jgi:hypothetical protein